MDEVCQLLETIKESAQCPICRDLLNVPVFLGCGHIFCSRCIRSSVQHLHQCPMCDQEKSLDPKPLHQLTVLCKHLGRLESMVAQLSEGLMRETEEKARAEAQRPERPSKRSKAVLIEEDQDDEEFQEPLEEEEEEEVDDDFIPSRKKRRKQKAEPLVVDVDAEPEHLEDEEVLCIRCVCDVCGKSVDLAKFDKHATACEAGRAKAARSQQRAPVQTAPVELNTTAKPMKKISKPYYKGLKSEKLRQLCIKVGLNVLGLNSEKLKSKHQKFCNLWNAYCDDLTANKTKKEVAREVDAEIRAQASIYGKDRVQDAIRPADLVEQARRSLPPSYKQSRKE